MYTSSRNCTLERHMVKKKNKPVSINCILLLLIVPKLCMSILFATISLEQSSENSQAKKERTDNREIKYVYWHTRCFSPCFHILTISAWIDMSCLNKKKWFYPLVAVELPFSILLQLLLVVFFLRNSHYPSKAGFNWKTWPKHAVLIFYPAYYQNIMFDY